MANEYSITCNCGETIKGTEPRRVEAEMWAHAMAVHNDTIKTMSADMLYGVMQGWDKSFAAQK